MSQQNFYHDKHDKHVFAATKLVFCHDKLTSVMTSLLLSWQMCFVMTKHVFCCDKRFVAEIFCHDKSFVTAPEQAYFCHDKNDTCGCSHQWYNTHRGEQNVLKVLEHYLQVALDEHQLFFWGHHSCPIFCGHLDSLHSLGSLRTNRCC